MLAEIRDEGLLGGAAARLNKCEKVKKRKPGLEPGPLIWLTSALAIELLPHEYAKKYVTSIG